jgi:hypothetical protein
MATVQDSELVEMIVDGGESGKSLQIGEPAIAMNAAAAVGHCPPLPGAHHGHCCAPRWIDMTNTICRSYFASGASERRSPHCASFRLAGAMTAAGLSADRQVPERLVG